MKIIGSKFKPSWKECDELGWAEEGPLHSQGCEPDTIVDKGGDH